MENLAMSVVCDTSNPTDVLDYLKQDKKIMGLYFLDLDLGCDINGIQLAEKIKTHDPFGCIVFITADGNSYKLTFEYKLEAMDYIVKGDFNLRTRLCECIQNAHDKLTSPPPMQDKFIFKLSQDTSGIRGSLKFAQNSIFSIHSNDVIYF